MSTTAPSTVTAVPPASPLDAEAHFARLLSLETDCWDVRQGLDSPAADFVLLDVRSPDAYGAGHVPGAVTLPHALIGADTLAPYREGTVFVVYCAGPHCNGADRAALLLARLGRPVKKMIGGVSGWLDEGFELTTDVPPDPSTVTSRAGS